MTSCPSCAAPVEPAARFCLECGFALDVVAEAAPDPWLGRLVAGRFKLLGKLGDGGMGEVYQAEQLPMGRHVALKILRHALSDDAVQVERFKREAQAASQLTHPNTIIVHDFGQDTDGTLFLAMEYLDGEPLSAMLAREGPLAGERAARILQQVCGSLEEAHRHNMVHRDLKPENIFLIERAGNRDYIKVLDFGIAKVTESGGQKLSTITQAGAIFGTPQYMAPEQIRGEVIDPRADVYALGVVLYEMISGHLPFAAGSVVEMLTKHLTASPAPINRKASEPDPVVARLEAVALRALSKNSESRQQSAREFLEDLMIAVPQLSMTSPTGLIPATPVATPAWNVAPSSGRGATRVVAITALMAALAAGSLFWFQGFGPGAGGGGNGVPVVVKQGAPDGNGGGAPASDAPPAGDAAPATEAVTAEQAAQAAVAEQAAEEEAKKAEADAAQAEADANKPMTDEEAARIAGEAEAQAAQAAAEAEKAAAEIKAKEAAEKAAAAESKKKEAEAAKANADADKSAAQQAASDAKSKQAEAEAQAAQAKAEAAAAAAKTEEEKAAAAAEIAKAQAELESVRQASAAAAAATAAAQAEAARLKTEAEALRAQLAQIEAEKAAAAAAEADAKARQEEAAERAKAAKAKKRVVGNSKVMIKTNSLGVRITVDGKARGVSPLRGVMLLKPGAHTIVATKGAKKVTKKITVKGGKVERFKLEI